MQHKVQHIPNLLHGHASTEDGSDGKVTAVARITSSHHVLSIKYLLRQLWHSQGPVLLAATRRQRSEARHEEMQTWEWNHVDGQFTQVSIQLSHSTTIYQNN